LLAAGSFAAAILSAAPAEAQTQPQPPQITVEGRAEELVNPDALRIVVGVETHGASHVEAMTENARIVAQVMDVARRRGIASADVQTGRLDLRPETGSYAGRSGGFRAVNLVSVTLRRITEADQMVAALLTAGANRLHGIALVVERSPERSARLREQAIAHAREVAEQSARAANVRLGPILSISAGTEDTASGGQAAFRSAGHAAGVPIEEGRVPVAVGVTMSWVILQ
jgi:uncharacterized protein YggE